MSRVKTAHTNNIFSARFVPRQPTQVSDCTQVLLTNKQKKVASTCANGELHITDIERRLPLAGVVSCDYGMMVKTEICLNGQCLAIASSAGGLLYDFRSAAFEIHLGDDESVAVCCDPSSDWIVGLGGTGPAVKLFDLRNPLAPLSTLRANGTRPYDCVSALQFSQQRTGVLLVNYLGPSAHTVLLNAGTGEVKPSP